MPIPRAVGQFNKRVPNKVLIHLAGHGSFAELEHVGRKSGTVRRMPINAFPKPDGSAVTLALTYGRKTDWFRNVRAAGGCRLRTSGGILTLGAPRFLDSVEGMSRMPLPAPAPGR